MTEFFYLKVTAVEHCDTSLFKEPYDKSLRKMAAEVLQASRTEDHRSLWSCTTPGQHKMLEGQIYNQYSCCNPQTMFLVHWERSCIRAVYCIDNGRLLALVLASVTSLELPPVVCNPGMIVVSDIQQIVQTIPDFPIQGYLAVEH